MVNSASLRRYSTLEVRLHSGTADADKIINWITLLCIIQDNAALFAHTKDVRSWSSLAKILDIGKDTTLYKFYDERIKKFAKKEATP